MESSYITSAQKAEQLPDFPWPEVAFVGRSNVGKSSLLNALMNRKDLARTSSTPGRTQMVNFFNLKQGDAQLIFADLPGYGYSAIGHDSRKYWENLVKAYVVRPRIAAYLFLLDSRRAAKIEEEDLILLQYITGLASSELVTIVMTKADKLSQSELSKSLSSLKKALEDAHISVRKIVPVSTLKKTGIGELRADVLKLFSKKGS
jgi:GTP-binding protein